MLFKRVSAAHRRVYTRYLPTIKRFSTPLTAPQLQRLRELGASEAQLRSFRLQTRFFALKPCCTAHSPAHRTRRICVEAFNGFFYRGAHTTSGTLSLEQ